MTWKKTDVDPAEVRELARRYGLELLPAAILARRSPRQPGARCAPSSRTTPGTCTTRS